MPDLEMLDEKLTRLENRVKTNFFEIEKKFAELSEKAPGGIEERLQEIEDLVLLVQLENTKIKEKSGNQGVATGTTDRISGLESAIKELKSAPPAADAVERLSKLESAISAQTSPEISARLSKLEGDINNLKAVSGKITPKEIEDDIAKINAHKIDLTNSILKFKSLKDDIERSLAERQNIFSKLDQVEINVEKASAYFTRMKTGEEKINAVASKIESLSDGIDAKIRSSAEKSEFLKKDIENRLAATEDKFKSRLEKLDAVMESLDIKSRGVGERIAELQSIEKDLGDAAAIRTGVEEQGLRMASMERNLSTINKHISGINEMKREMEEELSVRASLEKKMEDLEVRLDALKDVNAHIEEEAIVRQGLESRLQDVTSQLAGVRSAKAEIEKAVQYGLVAIDEKVRAINLDARFDELSTVLDSINKGIENKLNEFSSRIDSIQSGTEEKLSVFGSGLADIQQSIETLREPIAVATVAMEKAAQDKLREFETEVDDIKTVLHLDDIRNIRNEIAEHRKVIQSLKADLEVAAARFFTANLEEFARALDKKFPGFVSREEYAKHLNEISHRLKTIEAPDLSPMSTHVVMLEKKLEDVHAMMQDLVKTMPIVVE